MQVAKKGDKVKVHYVGTLDSGEEFDSSVKRGEPIEFEVGAGQMIAGFDKAVEGMSVGEKKNVHIPSEEAYGPVREEQMVKFPKEQIPADMNPSPGDQLVLTTADGQPVQVTVKELTDTHIVLDANHPMAGKDLNFAIELVEIA
ncbi:peptidylprolyl isomerase [Limibacter armeniacum]|uniref:FKBP-type peptidyl-prolyl cis-trans isomerase n=1 Tax=Limibacter armeniacum TaxID=466084 RepID=UPI002FE64723